MAILAAPTSLLTGKVIKTSDAKGNATYVLYDRFGRQSATYDATKHQTSASRYDAVDRVITATDTFGQNTNYSYQDAINQTTIFDPYSGTSYEIADTAGNLINEIDSLGRSTRHYYDRRNRQIQIIDAKGGYTRYTYTADDGNRTQTTDHNGHITNYIYDHLEACAPSSAVALKPKPGSMVTNNLPTPTMRMAIA